MNYNLDSIFMQKNIPERAWSEVFEPGWLEGGGGKMMVPGCGGCVRWEEMAREEVGGELGLYPASELDVAEKYELRH